MLRETDLNDAPVILCVISDRRTGHVQLSSRPEIVEILGFLSCRTGEI